MTEGREPPAGRGGPQPESLDEVLASIRALVSSETLVRAGGRAGGDVILLTPAMRVEQGEASAGEALAEDVEPRGRAPAAPIFDEAALRGMINEIVREELRGELGERIGRNLRKLIRRELAQMLAESREEK